jgi:hypothetical protein
MKENDKFRKTPRQLKHEQEFGDNGSEWKVESVYIIINIYAYT